MNEIKLAHLKELVEAVGASENKDTALGKANLLLRWRTILNPKNANLPSNPETYKQFETDLLEAYPWANSKPEFKQQLAHFKTTIAQIKKADPANAFADENQAWIDDTLNLVLGYNAKDTSFYLPALAERQAEANTILENQGVINLYNEVNPKLVEIKGWITKINQKQESNFYDSDLISDANAWLQTSDKTLARWLEYPEKAKQNLESIQANILHANGYYRKIGAMYENIYTIAAISKKVSELQASNEKHINSSKARHALLSRKITALQKGGAKKRAEIHNALKQTNDGLVKVLVENRAFLTGLKANLERKVKESGITTNMIIATFKDQLSAHLKKMAIDTKSEFDILKNEFNDFKSSLETSLNDGLDSLYDDVTDQLEVEINDVNAQLRSLTTRLNTLFNNANTKINNITEQMGKFVEDFNTALTTSSNILIDIQFKVDALTTKLLQVEENTKALIRVNNDTSSTISTIEAISITSLVIVAGGTMAKAGNQIRKVMKGGGIKNLIAEVKKLTGKNKKK